MTISLLLVGCGKMGGALLSRWQEAGIASIEVIDPSLNKNLDSLPSAYRPDVAVFAVKPQELAGILPAYAKRFGTGPLYISIAAGKSLAFFARHLGTQANTVRAMPNTPALIGQGMSVLCAAPALPASARTIATSLMEAVGKVEWLEDESLMDAVTAVSGSGPAYVFLFLDALAKAGANAGLPEPLARTLAVETFSGSCRLASGSGESFEQLRKNVASPGGTTEAALSVLMKDNALVKLMKEAVQAAAKRSRELAE